MPLYLTLRILTVVAAAFCLAGLFYLIQRTFAWGKKTLFSAPQGNEGKGLVYAFGKGMMPWEKESAALHMPTFVIGILYHGSILLSFFYLFWLILFPHGSKSLFFFRIGLATGSGAGLALLVKRLIKPNLRRLSCPDDFGANLFVDVFLIVSLLHTWWPRIEPLLLLIATFLFIYIPLGKIRHCFFFFYTRIVFGVFFGRRGVFPSPAREK